MHLSPVGLLAQLFFYHNSLMRESPGGCAVSMDKSRMGDMLTEARPLIDQALKLSQEVSSRNI